MGLRDEDWVSRSVAYSKECSEKVVDKSLELLQKKLEEGNKVPHKIIATACSIEHARQIKELYDSKGYPTAIMHSDLTDEEKEQTMNNIKNDRVKVVVNVAMLGEGYDHPFLSVAAVFRPFRNPLPYAQFVGRILRWIPQEIAQRAEDNVGQIVSHKHLGLDELWEVYKKEIQESEIIKHLKDIDIIEDDDLDSLRDKELKQLDIGYASERGTGILVGDVYLTTVVLKKKQEDDKIREQKIAELQKILEINREAALKVMNLAENNDSGIKRPDKYFASKKKDIDVTIKEIIVPELLNNFSINKQDDNLKNCALFNGKFSWIPGKVKDNGGLLAIYFTNYLNLEIGAKRARWTIDDYDIANDKLPEIVEYVQKIIEDFLNS